MSAEPAIELDITGGADPVMDEVTASVPSSASYREGASIWFWDDAGRFCFPRLGVEAMGATWTTSFETAICMAMPGERLFLATSDDPPRPVHDAVGRPRVLGAGPLTFECVEPFRHWRVAFDGRAVSTSVRDHLAGREPKPRVGTGHDEVTLRLAVDAHMVAPPWFQGTHDPEGRHVAGERRFEQLCSVTGSVAVDDGPPVAFTGGGLRVHRKGGDRNDYGDFHGHCWQSARFPSGRAFGFIHYRSGPDGAPRYREGWVLDEDGTMLPARVEGTPWLRSIRPAGEDVSFVLRTPRGEIRIEAETFASSFRPPRPTSPGASFPLLQSGVARYRWGPEEAYGMVERSARLAVDVTLD